MYFAYKISNKELSQRINQETVTGIIKHKKLK